MITLHNNDDIKSDRDNSEKNETKKDDENNSVKNGEIKKDNEDNETKNNDIKKDDENNSVKNGEIKKDEDNETKNNDIKKDGDNSVSNNETKKDNETKNNEARKDYMKCQEYYNVKQYETCFTYCEKAAKQDYNLAQNLLGILYEEGKGCKQDDEKALFWYNTAINKGDNVATFNLALFYERRKNNTKALEIFEKLAAIGELDAMDSIAWIYYRMKYYCCAKYWAEKCIGSYYNKSNNKVDRTCVGSCYILLGYLCQFEIRCLCQSGCDDIKIKNVETNDFKASPSDRALGDCKFNHESHINYIHAIVHYKKAIEFNNIKACIYLSRLLDSDYKRPNMDEKLYDEKESLKYYKLAAENGDVNSQWNLYVHYNIKCKDVEEAKKWLKMAAENCDEDAYKIYFDMIENTDVEKDAKYFDAILSKIYSDENNKQIIASKHDERNINKIIEYGISLIKMGKRWAMYQLGLYYIETFSLVGKDYILSPSQIIDLGYSTLPLSKYKVDPISCVPNGIISATDNPLKPSSFESEIPKIGSENTSNTSTNITSTQSSTTLFQEGIRLLHFAASKGHILSRQKLTSYEIIRNTVYKGGYKDIDLTLYYVSSVQEHLCTILNMYRECYTHSAMHDLLKYFIYEYGFDWREYYTKYGSACMEDGFPIILKHHEDLCHVYKYIINMSFLPMDVINITGYYISWFYLVDEEMKKKNSINVKGKDGINSNKKAKISGYINLFLDLCTR